MSFIFQQARLLNPLEQVDLTGTIKVSNDGIIEAVVYGNETPAAAPDDRVNTDSRAF
jgi:dihydroorotase